MKVPRKSTWNDRTLFMEIIMKNTKVSFSKYWVQVFDEGREPQRFPLKFIYSEKATKFCKTSILLWHYIAQKEGRDFAKFCGLLRIYELYRPTGRRPQNLKQYPTWFKIKSNQVGDCLKIFWPFWNNKTNID